MPHWPARFAFIAVGCAVASCGRIGFDLPDADGAGGKPPGADAAADGGAPGSGGSGGVPIDASTDAPLDVSVDVSVPDAAQDAPSPIDADAPDVDAAEEAALPEAGGPGCTVGRRWTFGFDSDPTAYDGDGDLVIDWVVRGGTPFPIAELDGGVWRSPALFPLDTRPLDDFDTRTIVDVRLRSLSVPASQRGAIFWVNLNQNAAAFSALFVSVELQAGGGQELTLYGKVLDTETPLAVFPDLPEALLDVHLDIDPAALSVDVTIDGVARGTFAIPATGPPNADRFATLTTWEGPSEFDFVDIVRCTP